MPAWTTAAATMRQEVCRPKDRMSVDRRSGVRAREIWMKKRLPSRKTVRAMRDFAHRYAGYAGCPEAPRAMNTVLPVSGQRKE
jgi:hypothetical protein